ncbi:23S rRNA (cytidine(2498)-2'-O)-methyltransferase RlmM [Motiliproteus sp. SC1-56]|uniref:23S rRNA (cytidine(2498)-2'-O)-methyltransferase RlmM n=1 Tax=Motiliproteus sp. SC1-56 TaxID=2799565 RepID=UPI001A9096E3|nr:23S rRNA (cytidine(2498)-2'-O)-methyltransferase RlmM [Motiliproteus sp. SC1-56]
MNHLILYCRPGFESECAAEIVDLAQTRQVFGYVKASGGDGYVCYVTQTPDGARRLQAEIRFRDLVFARQWIAAGPLIEGLPTSDRIEPLLAAAQGLPQCGELLLETADTNAAKELATFCRKFTSPCVQAFRRAGLLSATRDRRLPRLHLFFLDSTRVYMGVSPVDNSSPYSMGIRRLKFPGQAPSRSTLKLEEAWLEMLSAKEREHHLVPGLTAVDLGAAPGGWTWQLVRQHMRVTAVDNGPMASELMESGLVEHVREDGFRYQPPKPVHWMVCDIADKPIRVADRVALWFAQGWCERSVFNLKLPMKKRYQALVQCRDLIHARLGEAGVPFELDFKHLYHDREEVTGYLRRP